MKTLIQQVENYQRLAKLSDGEFCRRAGIHFTSWSRIKNGHRKPSASTLGAIASTFPELRLAVFEYLSSGNGGDNSTPHQSAPGQNPGG